MFKLETYSYRIAREVLDALSGTDYAVEDALRSIGDDPRALTREQLLGRIETAFADDGWEQQYFTFIGFGSYDYRRKFMKGRVCMLVEFDSPSYFGMDLLKFQHASYATKDMIDAGIYVVPTVKLRDEMSKGDEPDCGGMLTFEKVRSYLPSFRESIQVPIYVIGVDA